MILENSPDSSRVWVYGFINKLSPHQKEIVILKLEEFKSNWQYHGKPVSGDYEILEDRFVFLTTNDGISGCSIDSSVALFKDLKLQHALDALDQNLIFFRAKDGIEAVSRADFQAKVSDGEILDDTQVFNLTITTIADIRKGQFELDFTRSWHNQAFRRSSETVS
jgi:hypothetical protein